MTVTDENMIQEEIKRRFNSGNTIQSRSFLFSSVSKEFNYKTFCPWFCMCLEIWSDIKGGTWTEDIWE
jgi:hypothetical protein